MPSHTPPPATSPDDRRGFLTRLAAIAIGGIVSVFPMAAGLWMLLDPLRRKEGLGQFLRITDLESLPADGTPRQFPVVSDRTDAWNRYLAQPIGSVYLMRQGDDQVLALNTVCPHAGCFVDFLRSENEFRCPCHDSAFQRDGERIGPDCPSPRDLDSLEVDPQRLAQGEVWVRFQNFRAGKAEKIPES